MPHHLTTPAGRAGKRRLSAAAGALAVAIGSLAAGGPAAASSGPEADFTASCYDLGFIGVNGCTFNGGPSAGDITSWDWSFPNQMNTGTENPSGEVVGGLFYLPAHPGRTIQVTLTVTDASNRTDLLTKTVNITDTGIQ